MAPERLTFNSLPHCFLNDLRKLMNITAVRNCSWVKEYIQVYLKVLHA